MKKVCIVGAGSSGIAAAKELFQQGIAFDCFEKGSKIGGNWRFNNDNGMSSSYRSLHINTNRKVMAYSDYPMPTTYPMFPHHSQIIEYFENYVTHFGFRDHIQFNTEVLNIEPNTESTYQVTTTKGTTNYEYVIIANGHHWNPRYPSPAFEGDFSGEILHSHQYKTSDQIKGKNILIVGIGNSAVDIACEAARLYQGRVVISTRSKAYIVPNWLMGIPFDDLASPLTSSLPLWLQRKLVSASLWLARGKQENYGVPKPDRPILSEHPTLSQDLLNLSARGLIKFKGNIKRLEGKKVHFDDNSTEDFDTIVYATGYKISFPFFKKNLLDVEESNNLNLYKKIIHPDLKNLFFLAFIQPLGAIMPLAEIQSKWIVKIIKQKTLLPSPQEMQKSIEADQLAMQKRYKTSARHTIQVDFHPYMALIRKELR
jgi:dimethylaniline monooxygenase (N-oxide forming)